jgi:hypothetical protein
VSSKMTFEGVWFDVTPAYLKLAGTGYFGK